MEQNNTNAGAKLLFLLRQQRYLYHQLKDLTERQQKLAGSGSPELLLGIISGRRKLVGKLEELSDKLRPIKANWKKIACQIGPEHKTQAHETVNQIKEIIGRITAVVPAETAQNLPLYQDWRFDELFAETQ